MDFFIGNKYNKLKIKKMKYTKKNMLKLNMF